MTEYYEPWQPKIGDRVRIHLSPECRYPSGTTHDTRQDGRTGVVKAEPWPESNPVYRLNQTSHPYLVWFDVPYTDPTLPGETIATLFAAVELEPLGAEDPR